ncbi:phosphoglycerate dehydrogenase [Paenibacillus radicis (ex Gao et al. 2016)]|uniref:2-hydroxyacid dehydrogenase n=1 Tax=Paenibacillus radicis (ex Gao et al. 2016) TaxID=1737354 RepID=A0A917GQZ3_9BACL|nr:phosphoglycerate dehydrogenase [Paenibacillus radicis (ex Gao et al. 2016)]GGG54088.1 2-hydroxyacid dehydrogenase [Paenibacillus radicis (ex Gao et al. 2016)]
MPKVLITPKSFANYKASVYPLIIEQGYDIIENNLGRTMTEAEIVEQAREGVVGIIIGVDPLPAEVLAQCKDLRAVSKYGMGMDNIDQDKAKELGIQLRNAAGSNHISVAEHAIGLLFALARNIPHIVASVKQGHWERSMGIELTGKTIGVIGGGQIGREVALRAKGIGMQPVIYDPFLRDDSFLEANGMGRIHQLELLLEQADVVSLHLPYTPQTKHLINEETLARMKSSALLINTSRGELVDEDALYAALTSGGIAGAAQDVFSVEPPEAGHQLLQLDRFLLTSHTGAFTKEAVARMATLSTQNLLDMLNAPTEQKA